MIPCWRRNPESEAAATTTRLSNFTNIPLSRADILLLLTVLRDPESCASIRLDLLHQKRGHTLLNLHHITHHYSRQAIIHDCRYRQRFQGPIDTLFFSSYAAFRTRRGKTREPLVTRQRDEWFDFLFPFTWHVCSGSFHLVSVTLTQHLDSSCPCS